MAFLDNNEKNNSDSWKEKGNEFYKQGNYEEAIQCYHDAIVLNPTSESAWHNLGMAYSRAGKVEDSKFCFNKEKELSSIPKSPLRPKKVKPIKKVALFASIIILIIIIGVIVIPPLFIPPIPNPPINTTTVATETPTTSIPTTTYQTTETVVPVPTIIKKDPVVGTWIGGIYYTFESNGSISIYRSYPGSVTNGKWKNMGNNEYEVTSSQNISYVYDPTKDTLYVRGHPETVLIRYTGSIPTSTPPQTYVPTPTPKPYVPPPSNNYVIKVSGAGDVFTPYTLTFGDSRNQYTSTEGRISERVVRDPVGYVTATLTITENVNGLVDYQSNTLLTISKDGHILATDQNDCLTANMVKCKKTFHVKVYV